MYYVYIIKNILTNRHYIGSTNDLNRRISEHNRGQTKSTKYAKNHWVLILKEKFVSEIEAKQREIKIKSYKGGQAFKALLQNNNNIIMRA